MRRRLAFILAVGTLLVVVYSPAPAFANVCDDEDFIGWGAVYFDGSHYQWRARNYGGYGQIRISDRDLNTGCFPSTS